MKRKSILLLVLIAIGVGGVVIPMMLKTPNSSPSNKKETAKDDFLEGPPLFEEITKQTGIDFTYQNGEDNVVFAIIESLGGGIGVIDYDQDGLPDLFIPGGGYYEGKIVKGHRCKLYRNLGNFKFQDVTKEVGLDQIDWCYTHGAAVADYDCDGWPDLLVTGYRRIHLFHNEKGADGNRKLVEVTKSAQLNDDMWSISAAWGDLDGDGYPEVYIGHYGDWGFDMNNPTDCVYHNPNQRDVCQPRRFKPLPHSLWKNNGGKTFTNISNSVLHPKAGGHGIGVLMVDVNNDRRPEIYVANDTDDNYLYHNTGKLGEIVLEEKGRISATATDDRGNSNGSMGVDASSFNRSGLPSIMVTNYQDELPCLYVNRCKGNSIIFTPSMTITGISVIGGNYVSWGTGFFDIENRGWEDLLIVNGHAIRYPQEKFGRLQYPVLMKNIHGKFRAFTPRGGSYFQERHNARGVAFVDLNNDGKLDLVVNHLNAPVTILKNISETNHHWVGFNLIAKDHHSLVGARIIVTTKNGEQTEKQYRFAKGGGSHATTNDWRFHFGLGDNAKIESVVVEWPSGKNQEWNSIEADNYWTLTEGDAKVEKAKSGLVSN